MIYFLIFPLWLVGLALCAALAIYKPARVLAVYLALSGSFAVILSFVTSTLIVLLPGWLGLSLNFSGAGVVVLGGYLIGMVGGGVLGAVLGAGLAWWLTRKKRVGGSVAV
jgi:hypothetical protein